MLAEPLQYLLGSAISNGVFWPINRMQVVAGILVVRHLNTADDLFDTKSKTESMVAAAVQWGREDHEEN